MPPRKKKAVVEPVKEVTPRGFEMETAEEAEAFLSALPDDLMAKVGYAAVAQGSDSPDGYLAFYRLVHGRRPPKHVMEWVREVYEAREKGKGTVVEAFRGSTKTTAMTITFTAYRIGKEPHKSNLLIQVGDDIAQDNTAQIADIIANHEAWKLVFPNVEPDRDRGWGAGGYEVKRSDIPYEKWRELNAERKDPTLVGVGYKSREIIGKHPSGVLVVDDIHDENNTASRRELETVKNILTGTIFPTMTPDTWPIFIGTPWVDGDVLQYVKATQEFRNVRTPVVVDGAYTWEKQFGEAEVEKQKRLAGELQFARMFLLDLEAAKGINLKAEWLHEYPAQEIKASWPVIFGIDYASTADKIRDGNRDFFAIAFYRVIPGGGMVLFDGYKARVSKGEALSAVLSYWAVYPTLLRIGVESIGKGEEFYQDLILMQDVNGRVPPLVPIKSHSGRSKGQRFEEWLAPRFQHSRLWMSDAVTPFLLEFKRQWILWPKADHDDVLDAAYMGALTGEGYLPARVDKTERQYGKKRAVSPWFALAQK